MKKILGLLVCILMSVAWALPTPRMVILSPEDGALSVPKNTPITILYGSGWDFETIITINGEVVIDYDAETTYELVNRLPAKYNVSFEINSNVNDPSTINITPINDFSNGSTVVVEGRNNNAYLDSASFTIIPAGASHQTYSYTTPGEYQITVPVGAISARIVNLKLAAGGGGAGGTGHGTGGAGGSGQLVPESLVNLDVGLTYKVVVGGGGGGGLTAYTAGAGAGAAGANGGVAGENASGGDAGGGGGGSGGPTVLWQDSTQLFSAIGGGGGGGVGFYNYGVGGNGGGQLDGYGVGGNGVNCYSIGGDGNGDGSGGLGAPQNPDGGNGANGGDGWTSFTLEWVMPPQSGDQPFASPTDVYLNNPAGYTTTTNFIPVAHGDYDADSIQLIAGGIEYHRWGFYGGGANTGSNEYMIANGTTTNFTVQFYDGVDIGSWRGFASADHNGMKTFYLPKNQEGDTDGGYFNYYYLSDAWTLAFDGNRDNIVISKSGAVYKGSIAPGNLVVNQYGLKGPAAGGSATWDSQGGSVSTISWFKNWGVADDIGTFVVKRGADEGTAVEIGKLKLNVAAMALTAFAAADQSTMEDMITMTKTPEGKPMVTVTGSLAEEINSANAAVPKSVWVTASFTVDRLYPIILNGDQMSDSKGNVFPQYANYLGDITYDAGEMTFRIYHFSEWSIPQLEAKTFAGTHDDDSVVANGSSIEVLAGGSSQDTGDGGQTTTTGVAKISGLAYATVLNDVQKVGDFYKPMDPSDSDYSVHFGYINRGNSTDNFGIVAEMVSDNAGHFGYTIAVANKDVAPWQIVSFSISVTNSAALAFERATLNVTVNITGDAVSYNAFAGAISTTFGDDGVYGGVDDLSYAFTFETEGYSLKVLNRVATINSPLSDGQFIPGAKVKYEIVIKNENAAVATDVRIKDVIPANTHLYYLDGVTENQNVVGALNDVWTILSVTDNSAADVEYQFSIPANGTVTASYTVTVD